MLTTAVPLNVRLLVAYFHFYIFFSDFSVIIFNIEALATFLSTGHS